MTVQNPEMEARVERIATLSPTARAILENHMTHIVLTVDEIDTSAILEEVCLALIEDMSEIGLYFTVSNEEIFADNWLRYDEVLSVLEWIMPTTLYPKLKQYPTLKTLLTTTLEGVSDDPIIEVWCDAIGRFVPDIAEPCVYVRDRIRCTDVFVTFLENQLTLISEERIIQASPIIPNDWYVYRNRVIEHSSKAFFAVVNSEKLEDADQVALARRMDMNLVRPFGDIHQQDRLVFIYLSNFEQMSTEARAFYNKVVREYRVGCKFFTEYYQARDKQPTMIDLLGILIYRYAISADAAALEKSYEALITQYGWVNDNFKSLAKGLVSMKGTDGG